MAHTAAIMAGIKSGRRKNSMKRGKFNENKCTTNADCSAYWRGVVSQDFVLQGFPF